MLQVVNRDLSVAVLKQFSKLRREELASGKLKPKAAKSGIARKADLLAEANKHDPKDLRILEGLAATGLRALRYALEVLSRTLASLRRSTTGHSYGLDRVFHNFMKTGEGSY